MRSEADNSSAAGLRLDSLQLQQRCGSDHIDAFPYSMRNLDIVAVQVRHPHKEECTFRGSPASILHIRLLTTVIMQPCQLTLENIQMYSVAVIIKASNGGIGMQAATSPSEHLCHRMSRS
jgi:hypothetical protein